MIKHSTKIRVRYSETDRMGFVYYGNYAQYLEIGRVETLRKHGISYKELEDKGYYLPVKDMNIQYIRAAVYDDELEITTSILTMPSNKISFDYEIHRGEELLIKATTTLFFMDSNTKACKPPSDFLIQMKSFFN